MTTYNSSFNGSKNMYSAALGADSVRDGDDELLLPEAPWQDSVKATRGCVTKTSRIGCVATVALAFITVVFLTKGSMQFSPPKMQMSLRGVKQISQAFELNQDPLRIFDCRTAWCQEKWYNETERGPWNSRPIDGCAAECLKDDSCTGFTSKTAPFYKDKCLLWYRHKCSTDKEEQFGSGLAITLGIRAQTCARVQVSVMGKWVPIFIVATKMDKEVSYGKTQKTTEAWNTAVNAKYKDAFGVGVGHATSSVSSSTETNTFSHHFDPKNGGQVWQWWVEVTTKNKPGYITIKTENVVQTLDRLHIPKCLPGYSTRNSHYQECIGGMYVANATNSVRKGPAKTVTWWQK